VDESGSKKDGGRVTPIKDQKVQERLTFLPPLTFSLSSRSGVPYPRMNSRKSAKAIPSTLNRFLKSRALLKSPPPSFYPLAAHPPPPSLVRSFPTRDEQDLSLNSPTRSVLESQRAGSKKELLNQGIRLQPHELLNKSPLETRPGRNNSTRRKPPKKFNPKTNSRPEEIVFPEDKIRKRFYLDHPFEAYRPVDLVETDQINNKSREEGLEWTELRQRSLNPSPEE